MSRGFSLIELAIGVMILAILVAIAIPQYTSMIRTARETGVIAFIKQWQQAEESFFLTYGGYTTDPDELVSAGFIGGNAPKADYQFKINLGPYPDATGAGKKKKGKGKGSKGGNPSSFSPRAAWWGTAEPTTSNSQARYFYTDQSGIIIAKIGAAPTPGDPASVPLGK